MFKYLFAEVARLKKIGRPRKAARKEQISVNLPKHIINEINDSISWQQSRSVWIETAIINRLRSKKPSITDYGLNTLLFEAIQREEIDSNVKFVIKNYLDSTVMKQSEETAE